MKMSSGTLLLTLILIAAASQNASVADRTERIWILPFTQLEPDPDLEYLQDALPALLAVTISGSGSHSIVEREALNLVLDEQSLALESLTSPGARQRVGKLLGATMMVTGSFARQGPELHVTMRASDLGTGIVAAAADGLGAIVQPGALVSSLYGRLASDLGRRLPSASPHQIDDAPLANLHFMKGLGHYHGARFSHSIAEFMLAGEDRRLADVSRVWLAKAYLALRQYSHACLELITLTNGTPMGVEAHGVGASMRECERHVGRDDMKMIREMAARRDRMGK
jgi:TolB-like protein